MIPSLFSERLAAATDSHQRLNIAFDCFRYSIKNHGSLTKLNLELERQQRESAYQKAIDTLLSLSEELHRP